MSVLEALVEAIFLAFKTPIIAFATGAVSAALLIWLGAAFSYWREMRRERL